VRALALLGLLGVLAAPRVAALKVGAPVAVGEGAGAPAVAANAVWVPTTWDGRLVSVAKGRVGRRTRFGVPGTRGYLDSAVTAGASVWAASDFGGVIGRFDASGKLVRKLTVTSRPGGLAEGGGYVWAFHFLQETVTRIDEKTNALTRFQVSGLSATGIAFGGDSVWLLGVDDRVFRLDPSNGQVLQTVALKPTLKHVRSFIETWWLAYGDGALWATLPNDAGVVRVDAATGAARYVGLSRYGDPFGVAVGGGSAWVATERSVVRLDDTTGAVLGSAKLPAANVSGFVSIAYGQGAAWLTNYDRGTLVRITT
jgi:streptogramin lyase